MTPRMAIYARVSTTNHGQDVTLQTRELEQFGEARGWRSVGAYSRWKLRAVWIAMSRAAGASWRIAPTVAP